MISIEFEIDPWSNSAHKKSHRFDFFCTIHINISILVGVVYFDQNVANNFVCEFSFHYEDGYSFLLCASRSNLILMVLDPISTCHHYVNLIDVETQTALA